MKRLLIIFPLLLILLFGLCSPTPMYSGVDEIELQQAFIKSADGDSVTITFSDTLDGLGNDILHYPDMFYNDTLVFATSDTTYTGSLLLGDYSSLEEKGESDVLYWDSIGGVVNASVAVPIPSGGYIEGVKICVYIGAWDGVSGPTDTKQNLTLQSDSNSWLEIGELPDYGDVVQDWVNYTTYDPDYWNSTHVEIGVYAEDGVYSQVIWDYLEVTFYIMTNADLDHHAWSFADVGDWSTSDVSISSNEDVCTITENGAGTEGYAYYDFDSPTDISGLYFEIRIEAINGGGDWKLRVSDIGVSGDDLRGWTVSNGTFQGPIPSNGATTACDRIMLFVRDDGDSVEVDYLRIGPADELGWSHDGSTTQGTSKTVGTDVVWSLTSDGDILTGMINGTSTPDLWESYYVKFDTTSTLAEPESDYYPFYEMHVRFSWSDNTGVMQRWAIEYDSKKYLDDMTLNNTWQTIRVNWDAETTASSAKYIRFGGYFDSADDWIKFELDYSMFYSIANYTVTGGWDETTDLCYVSSGSIYFEGDDYIRLDYDPTLGLDADTYNVCNLTVSDADDSEYQFYDDTVWTQGETRFALTGGTMDDFAFQYRNSGDGMTLSAIKFIEDATAPSVVRSNANPTSPYDDEIVTLSAVVSDAVEVYTVKFNAVTTTAVGFSDVDYSATEIANNLWTYSFTAGDLPNGYYCFSVTASDGANTNSLLTEPEFIEFTIRPRDIDLSYAHYEANDDNSYWFYSATVNQDVNYYVWDNDTLQESGTKSAGFFQITRSYVNTIGVHIWKAKFNTSSDSEWVGGQYEVTSTLDFDSIDPDQDNETVTLGFRVLKSASNTLTYIAYESGTTVGNGTIAINEGDFFSCSFDKSAVNVEGNATVVFSDGTSSRNVTVIYLTIDQSDITNNSTGGSSTIINIESFNESLEIRSFRTFTKEDIVYVVGYTTLDCDYTLYHQGERVKSGSLRKGSFSIRIERLYLQVVNVTIVATADGQEPFVIYSDYGNEGIIITQEVALMIAIGVPVAIFFVALAFRYLRDKDILRERRRLL